MPSVKGKIAAPARLRRLLLLLLNTLPSAGVVSGTMCTIPPTTEKNIGQPAEVVGRPCPLCGDGTPVGYMKFRDPHGVDRIDAGLFECAAKRHTFTFGKGVLRVLTSDGARIRERREFGFGEGDRLVEIAAP